MSDQDVQRLEGDAQQQIILPRVLGSLTKHDTNLLIRRASLLDSGKHKVKINGCSQHPQHGYC